KHQQQRHEQAKRRRGLDPRGVETAFVLRRVLSDVNCGTTVFAAERETLRQTQTDQNDRRDDAGGRVGRQQTDKKGADTHQRHGDEEGVLAADDVTEPAEKQRTEWAHRKTGGESEQREDESRRRIDAGKELRRQNGRQRSVDIEVVPLEYCAKR